jgi:chemotaxis protein CheC
MQEAKHFTIEGIAALEKMAQNGAEGASEALSKLINQKTQISTVQVRATPIEKVSDFIADPDAMVTAVRMALSGDVFGNIMLIYPEQSALNIADMLSKRPLGTVKDIDELDKSALKESGNIISGAFLTAISNYLDINMIESTPNLEIATLKTVVDASVALFVDNKIAESIAMEINFNLLTGSEHSEAEKIVPSISTQGYFIILLDLASAAKVSASLKTISGGQKMTEGGGIKRIK